MQVEEYFMSIDEQDAVVGRIAREHAALRREITLLEAEIDKAEKLYGRLEIALRQSAQMTFDEECFTGTPPYSGFLPENYHFNSSEIDGAKLKTLVRDLNTKRDSLKRLAAQMKELGL